MMTETDPNSARCIVWATVGDLFFVFSILRFSCFNLMADKLEIKKLSRKIHN